MFLFWLTFTMLFTARHGGSFVKFVNVYHFLVQKPGMRGIVNGSVFVMVCGFCDFVTVYILLPPSHTYYIYPPPTNPCHFPFQLSGSLCAGNVPVAILCPVCANSLALPIINVPYFRGIRFRFHYFTIPSGFFALARGTVPTPSVFPRTTRTLP